MVEELLKKAIESYGEQTYSPQQVAQMLDSQRDAIVMLDDKISFIWWILFSMIIGFAILNLCVTWRLEKRLKKLEK